MSDTKHDERSGCPRRGEAGYVHAVRARKANGGGWVVCYDRQLGPPGLTSQNCPWTDDTRYMVRWFPATGPAHKRYWATSAEDKARAALHQIQRGGNPCGFWQSAPVEPAVTPKTQASKLAAQSEREDGEPRACVREDVGETSVQVADASRVRAREEPAAAATPAVPPGGAVAMSVGIKRPPTKVEEIPLNQLIKELLRREVPEASVVRVIKDGMNATKVFFTDGEPVEVEDHATRQKFVQLWLDYQLGKAAQEERSKEKKVLDESHLEELLMQSPAARREMRALLDEIDRAQGGVAA